MQHSTFFFKQVHSPPGCRAKLEAREARSVVVWEEGGGSPSGLLIWGKGEGLRHKTQAPGLGCSEAASFPAPTVAMSANSKRESSFNTIAMLIFFATKQPEAGSLNTHSSRASSVLCIFPAALHPAMTNREAFPKGEKSSRASSVVSPV